VSTFLQAVIENKLNKSNTTPYCKDTGFSCRGLTKIEIFMIVFFLINNLKYP
jgi:hypothetical protein